MSSKKSDLKSSIQEANTKADLEAVKSRIVEAIDLEIDKFRGSGFEELAGTYSRPDSLGGTYTRSD